MTPMTSERIADLRAWGERTYYRRAEEWYEAIDEIERLRSELASLRDEIERLRVELDHALTDLHYSEEYISYTLDGTP